MDIAKISLKTQPCGYSLILEIKSLECHRWHATSTEPASRCCNACPAATTVFNITAFFAKRKKSRKTNRTSLTLPSSQAIASIWQKSNLKKEPAGRCLESTIFSFLKIIAQEIS